jgi:hypothetical protein
MIKDHPIEIKFRSLFKLDIEEEEDDDDNTDTLDSSDDEIDVPPLFSPKPRTPNRKISKIRSFIQQISNHKIIKTTP